MSNAAGLEVDVIAEADRRAAGFDDKETVLDEKAHANVDVDTISNDEDVFDDTPTEEELRTLRRVSGSIKWAMYTIAFVELCERFSYYGSSILYTNFVNRGLPPGSTTGAPTTPDGLPGALGMGPKAAMGISLFNQFWAYIMPLMG
jgi:POT family proton-dependent oligopeptide transporter